MAIYPQMEQNCIKSRRQSRKEIDNLQLTMHITSPDIENSWGLYDTTSECFNSSAILNCSTGFPLNIILKFVNFLRYNIETYAYTKDKN